MTTKQRTINKRLMAEPHQAEMTDIRDCVND